MPQSFVSMWSPFESLFFKDFRRLQRARNITKCPIHNRSLRAQPENPEMMKRSQGPTAGMGLKTNRSTLSIGYRECQSDPNPRFEPDSQASRDFEARRSATQRGQAD